MPAALAELDEMRRVAGELRQPTQEWLALVYTGLIGLLQGRLEEAEETIMRARELGVGALEWSANVSYVMQLYLLRREQGRLDEIEELVERTAQECPTYPVLRCVLAALRAEVGNLDGARQMLEAIAQDEFAALPVDEEWLLGMCLLSESAHALADRGRASAIYAKISPYSDRVAIAYPESSVGPVARYLGLLAATCERPEDARRHFTEAIELNQRIGATLWLQRTRREYEALAGG
jgi:tetratricopeptide (TPR) repeat protein